MSTSAKKLGAVLKRLQDLRACGVDNYSKLSSLFIALRTMTPNATASDVADIGRFVAEDMSSEFEVELDSLIGLLDGLIKQTEGRSQ
ncbi:hypothetical protein PQR67_03445 [Paraburkholderia fungorum]|uniref:hypothetical protein n=1 Tax=Paraburkholderia fungorum TaxID=134537 RepID=UPI0038BDF440